MTVFCLVLIVFVSVACAVDVNLQWDEVIHPDLAGYNIYQSEAQGNTSTAWVSIGTTALGVTVFSVTLPDELKTYTWTVTAFSTRGEESRVSNPVSRFKTGIFQFAPQNLTK
jgi:hypothetical protein